MIDRTEEFISALKRRLEKEIEPLKDSLALGRVPSFEEYKRVTGEIRGLHLAIETIDALTKKLRQPDDDD